MPNTAIPDFDPTKPFTDVPDNNTSAPPFDPSKPFTDVPEGNQQPSPRPENAGMLSMFQTHPDNNSGPLSIVQNAPQITGGQEGQASVSPSGDGQQGSAQVTPTGTPYQPVAQSMFEGLQKAVKRGIPEFYQPDFEENQIDRPISEVLSQIPHQLKEGAKQLGEGFVQMGLPGEQLKAPLNLVLGAAKLGLAAAPPAIEFNASLQASKDVIAKLPYGEDINNGIDKTMNGISSLASLLGRNPKQGSAEQMFYELGDNLLQAGAIAGGHKIKSMSELKSSIDKAEVGELTPDQQKDLAENLNNISNVTPSDVINISEKKGTPESDHIASSIKNAFTKPEPPPITDQGKHDLLYDFVSQQKEDPIAYKAVSDQIKSRADVDSPQDAEDLEKLNHYEDTYNQIKPQGLNDVTNKEILQTSWDAQQQIKLMDAIEANESWKKNANMKSDHDIANDKFKELTQKIKDLKTGKKEVLEGDHYKTVYEKPEEKEPNVVITPKDIVETPIPEPTETKAAGTEPPKLNPIEKPEVLTHHVEDGPDMQERVGGQEWTKINEDVANKEKGSVANTLADNGVTKVETTTTPRGPATGEKINEAVPEGHKFDFVPNDALKAWDIGNLHDAKEDPGFSQMTREGFKPVEDYFQDHPNETKLPDDFFSKKEAEDYAKKYPNDPPLTDYNGRSVGESWNSLVTRLANETNRLHADPNGPPTIAMLTHSKNIKILDAMRKNGGAWDDKAKELYRADKGVASMETRIHPPGPESIEGHYTPKEEPPVQIGTKNAVTKGLQQNFGLEPIELPPIRSGEEWIEAGKNGVPVPTEIVDRLNSEGDIYSKSISPNEEAVMIEYFRQLKIQGDELNKTRVGLEDVLSELSQGTEEHELVSGKLATATNMLLDHYDNVGAAINAEQVAGRVWSEFGKARQITVNDRGEIINSINRIHAIYGRDIPADVAKKVTEIQKRYDELLAKNNLVEKKLEDLEAAKKIRESRGKVLGIKKKSAEEFGKERKDILSDMKEALRKASGQTYATLPGVPQLNAIAPHVLRLVRSLAEEGVVKLDDVLSRVHDSIKDFTKDITKDDIRDIILGKHNENERSKLSRKLLDPKITESERKTINDRLSKLQTKEELAKKLSEIKAQASLKDKIQNTERGIVSETKGKGESSKEVQGLTKKLSDLKKIASNKFANVSAAELKKQSAALSKRIEKGEFFKMPTVKRSFESNPTWVKNNKERINLKQEIRNLESDAFESRKGYLMKGLDWTNRWGRRVIFFGSNAVYTKLSSAAVVGSFVHRIPEQLLGMANIKMFPEIARLATMEGNVNLKAEVKFYKEFLDARKFVKNTKDIIVHGTTDLSKELSTYHSKFHIPVIDLFASDGHIIIKDPVKRATFEAAHLYYLDFMKKSGEDISHPLIIEAARQAAYKRAEYEIFQERPIQKSELSEDPKGIAKYFNDLEKQGVIDRNKADAWSRSTGNSKYLLAQIYRFVVPIVTVPANMLKRTMLGLKAPLTLREAYLKNKAVADGIMTLNADEANLLMLQLKKGQVGMFYWTAGFLMAGSAAGGLYTKFYPDKNRDEDTAKTDEMNISGLDIPKGTQHITQYSAFQMGATWKLCYSHFVDDEGLSQMEAITKSTIATGGVAARKLPQVEALEKWLEGTKDESGYKYFEKDLKRRAGINKAEDLLDYMGYGDEQ